MRSKQTRRAPRPRPANHCDTERPHNDISVSHSQPTVHKLRPAQQETQKPRHAQAKGGAVRSLGP